VAVAVKKNFSVLSCLALLQVASSAFAEESKQQTEIDADVRKSTITSYEPTYAPELIELKNGKGCTGLSKPFEYKLANGQVGSYKIKRPCFHDV